MTGIVKTDQIQGAGSSTVTIPSGTALNVTTVSGTPTFSGDVTLPSINGGQIGGRRNLVINGSMQVAQRGTSDTVAGYGTVDRFTFPYNGSDTITQSQGTLSSSDSPYADGFRYYARNTNTNTSSGTAAYAGIKTIIESQDMAQSGWEYTSTSSTVTIQFWARSSITGTYYMNLRSNDTTVKNFTIPVALTANTWKKITATAIGNTGLVFNNDNGAGLSIIMWMHLGTDYTTSGHTTNAWQTSSGSDQAPDYSIDWRNTSGATFDLTGIQLEVGSQATPFEHRSFGQELALCQRYYYKSMDGSPADNIPTSDDTSGNGYMGFAMYSNSAGRTPYFYFPVEMRADPTVTVYSSARANTSGKFGLFNQSAWVATSTTLPAVDINRVTFSITHGSTLSAGFTYLLAGGFDADAEL